MLFIFKLLLVFILSFIVACYGSTNWLSKNLCYFRECCHENDGTGYLFYEKGCDNLLTQLKNKIYGQPFIVKPIYNALRQHLTNDRPARPLVMYFSGWTGTGKTYVAQLIASSLYKEGMNSRFVKYISSSYHFPIKIDGAAEINRQRNKLRNMIRDTVQSCDRSLIILDELDKLPSGVVDVIQPLVDYIEDVDGVKYNKAIFLFLSNTGALTLNSLSYQMFTEGKERKDLNPKDIEELLVLDSFNEEGGLAKSALIKRHSISLFVPFLPLERSHVKLCIKDEFRKLKMKPIDKDELIEEIADEITYFPNDTQLYSKSGCKGVHDKVVNYIGPPIQPNDISPNSSDGDEEIPPRELNVEL